MRKYPPSDQGNFSIPFPARLKSGSRNSDNRPMLIRDFCGLSNFTPALTVTGLEETIITSCALTRARPRILIKDQLNQYPIRSAAISPAEKIQTPEQRPAAHSG